MKPVTGIVVVAQAEAPLAELARQIAAAHEGCERALKEGLAHALEAGRLLAEAKRRVAHGEWQDWVRTNCPFSVRTAQSYMSVVSRFDALSEAEAQRVALLSYREAVHELTGPREGDQVEEGEPAVSEPDISGTDDLLILARGRRWKPFLDLDPAVRHDLVAKWWDIGASRTVALNLLGWDVDRIAPVMGWSEDEVEKILQPAPPVRFNTEVNGADMGDGLFGNGLRGCRTFRRLYTDMVQEVILGAQRVIHERASYAAWLEGWPEVEKEAEVLARNFGRQSQRLFEKNRWALSALPDGYWCATYVCALSDARAGLGIEEIRQGHDGWLLFMWHEMYQLVQGVKAQGEDGA
jgi:hypothetical protein